MSNSTKYAVMVPLTELPLEESWVFITEGDSKFQLRTKLFDSREAAKEVGECWGVYEIVEVEDGK